MKELLKRLSKPDTRTALALLVTLGVFSFIGILFIKQVPDENVPILNTLLPMTFTLLSMCFGFYFGAAKNEQDKQNQPPKP